MLCMLNIAIILGPFAIENLSQSFNLKKTNKQKKLEKTTRKQTSKQNAGSMVITS